MKAILYQVAGVLFQMGGLGLLAMGVLDSSFLFMPLGNDLLVVALSAAHPWRVAYYALMATAGSLAGCLIIDLVSRKGGEKGLDSRLPRRRLEYVKRRVRKRAGWALALAAVMPPPFPFTPFVAAAAALDYPRKRLLGVIGIARLVRFLTAGLLAIAFGRRILRLAESPAVQYVIVALVVISIAGSVYSIYGWIKRSGSRQAGRARRRAA